VGTLVAFDKFCNLLLRSVAEEYTVLVRRDRPTQGGGTRCARVQEHRSRRMAQVMYRGSSVVTVQALPAAGGAG